MPTDTIDGIKNFDLDKQIEWSELRQLWDRSRKVKVGFFKTFFKVIFNWSDYMRLADYGSKVITSYKIPYKLPRGFEQQEKKNNDDN
jgi:hypothetical protein